ncbi:MAG: hypothetical protein WKF83_10185 [Nocardioidaceae bacterium]
MSGTHGTPRTASGDTGQDRDRDAALAAVTRAARELIPEDGVITDHMRLRTYECDGLAHYKVTPGPGRHPGVARAARRV